MKHGSVGEFEKDLIPKRVERQGHDVAVFLGFSVKEAKWTRLPSSRGQARMVRDYGIRASFFLDQSQTLIFDGHLWSFFAAGDNRPDVYVGLLASSDLSPEHTPHDAGLSPVTEHFGQ